MPDKATKLADLAAAMKPCDNCGGKGWHEDGQVDGATMGCGECKGSGEVPLIPALTFPCEDLSRTKHGNRTRPEQSHKAEGCPGWLVVPDNYAFVAILRYFGEKQQAVSIKSVGDLRGGYWWEAEAWSATRADRERTTGQEPLATLIDSAHAALIGGKAPA